MKFRLIAFSVGSWVIGRMLSSALAGIGVTLYLHFFKADTLNPPLLESLHSRSHTRPVSRKREDQEYQIWTDVECDY